MPELTVERLREVLDYSPETGVFRWRVTRPKCPAGKIAGTARSDWYVRIGIDGVRHLAHRLAWLHFYGTPPVNHIDHIDNNKRNNRISNLRDVPALLNIQNAKLKFTSTRPLPTGVRQKSHNVWSAQICANRKIHFLGCFDSVEKAASAYLVAKRSLHKNCPLVENFDGQMPERNGRPLGRSGVVGVTWNSAAQKWESKIKVNGRYKRLGRFTDIDSASLAYQRAIKEVS